MAALVIAEHDNRQLKPGVTNSVTAAHKADGEVHVLVAGQQCAQAAQAAARIEGVKKVLVADAPQYAGLTAENLAALVVSLAPPYSHLLAPATAFGCTASTTFCSWRISSTSVIDATPTPTRVTRAAHL